jgi:hypothetical protein
MAQIAAAGSMSHLGSAAAAAGVPSSVITSVLSPAASLMQVWPSMHLHTAPSAAAAAPAGKDFLAQLGAIATDGTRGYKYRASDGGHGAHSFLQNAATSSLQGRGSCTAEPPVYSSSSSSR